ncbi:MAG: fibronectin type III domain-containing protein, partial [Bacteroidales bacterium]|nr:fibronectin type III domain-containing protein [Bacteroidales bacterium]
GGEFVDNELVSENESMALNIRDKQNTDKPQTRKLFDEAQYKIEQNGHKLKIKTLVEISWLTSSERNYPVKIDPTVNVTPNNANRWSVSVYDDGYDETTGYFGRVSGYWLRYHIKFNTSSVPTTSVVNSVTGYYYLYGADGTNHASRGWQWSNSADPTNTYGTNLHNSANLGYSNIEGIPLIIGYKGSTFYNPEGNTYVENSLVNGYVVVALVPAGDFNFTDYYAARTHQDSDKPYLSITYTAPSGPPSCSNLLSPTNGSSISGQSTILSWSASAGATNYDLYFGTSSSPALYVSNLSSSTTSYNVSNLTPGTTYYWKVVPKNVQGSAQLCDVWSFTLPHLVPQFHNSGGEEQLTFDNSAYQADEPVFRISNTNPMQEVHIQISQDHTFSGTPVYDGSFTGNFSGENNFTTTLSGGSSLGSQFPQPFDNDVLTHGSTGSDNSWFAPEYSSPISWEADGGNPGGRVGYSGNWNNYWGNFLRLPAVDASGMDEITLSFDVWNSYSTSTPNNKLRIYVYADEAYKHIVSEILIDGIDVNYTDINGAHLMFSEERDAVRVDVNFDLTSISNKSNILLYLEPSCGYNNSTEFYIYFDNIDLTGESPEFTHGST